MIWFPVLVILICLWLGAKLKKRDEIVENILFFCAITFTVCLAVFVLMTNLVTWRYLIEYEIIEFHIADSDKLFTDGVMDLRLAEIETTLYICSNYRLWIPVFVHIPQKYSEMPEYIPVWTR